MNVKIFIKQILLALTLVTCVVGCTPLKSSRTIALSGLAPIPDVKRVRVVEELKDVTQPYQIVGKVTSYREGTKMTQSGSIKRLSAYAAEMGADGIIGVHRNAGGGLYSALAVKWLAAGEQPKPLKVPFIATTLPVAFGTNAPAKRKKYEEMIRAQLDYLLETKGYYLMPGIAGDYTGGIAGAMNLEAAALEAVGGREAQVLVEISLVTHAGGAYSGRSTIRAVLLDKSQRTLIHDSHAGGGANAGDVFVATGLSPLFTLVLPVFMPNALREEAALRGTFAALKDLKPIHQKTGE